MNELLDATEDIISTERLITLELRRAVAREADALTDQAHQLVTSTGRKGLTNAQINGLLNVMNTTDTVSDVIRYLERQASRREAWQEYARQLIQAIRSDLSDTALEVAQTVHNRVSNRYSREDEAVTALTEKKGRLPEVHILLVREFIQSFGISYLYNFPD